MFELFDDLASALIQATGAVTVSAILVGGLIWWLRPHSAKAQRLLWMVVLFQGLVLIRFPLEIPWFEAEAVEQSASIQEAEDMKSPLLASRSLAEPTIAPDEASHVATEEQKSIAVAVVPVTTDQTDWSWSQLGVATWLVGMMAVALVALARYESFARRASRRKPGDATWEQEWLSVLDEADVNQRISFGVTEDFGPALCLLPSGYSVLVPEQAWRILTVKQRLSVLHHELAHYQRGDLWKSMLAGLPVLVHWFNPLAWWALGRYRTCGEWSCDEFAATKNGEKEFARTLMKLAGVEMPAVSLVNSIAGGPLFTRIKRLLAGQQQPDTYWKKTALFALGLVLLAVGVAQFELVVRESEAAQASRTISAESPSNAVDLYGDPLPNGAISRLGTIRFQHGSRVAGLQFAGDGKTLISLSDTESIRFWDIPSGKLLRELDPTGQYPVAMRVAPDGKRLASLGWHWNENHTQAFNTIMLWDIATLKLLSTITWQEPDRSQCRHFVFADEGKTIITGSTEGLMRVWNVETGKQRSQKKIFERTLDDLTISPNGEVIAVTDRSEIKLWKWQTKAEPTSFRPPIRRAFGMQFSPDGKVLAVGGYDPKSAAGMLLDSGTGKLIRRISIPEGAHLVGKPIFTSNGRTLYASVSFQEESEVVAWDTSTGRELRRIKTLARRPVISSDDRWLAAEANSGAIKVWDLQQDQAVAEDVASHEAPLAGIHFSSQDGTVITTSDDGTIRSWDAQTGRHLKLLGRHEKWIRASALSPDGKLVATSSMDDSVRLWDAESGAEVHRMPGHGKIGGWRALEFSADGRSLASWGDDMDVRLWNVATGKLIKEYEIHPAGSSLPKKGDPQAREKRHGETKGGLDQSAFNRNAWRFVLNYGNTLHVFDVETGKEVLQIHKAGGPLTSMATSPDGLRLLTGTSGQISRIRLPDGGTHYSEDKEHRVQLWDLATGKELHKIVIPGRFSGPVAFSQDGKRIAEVTRAPQGTIRIWDAESWKQLLNIAQVPQSSWSQTPTFSPDGKMLAYDLRDSTVLIWNLNSQ